MTGKTTVVTGEDIERGLASVGLKKGDIVLVHSSLSSFGYVAGGADAVVDALLETVGAEGTVVAPTFTWFNFHDKENVVFDLNDTPGNTGKITECLRKRKGAARSVHMCHSVTALGARAQDVLGDGIKPFGSGSTFHQLYQLDAWVLLLGVGFSSCTELHAVEEYLQVPYRHYRDFKGSVVVLPDGTSQPSASVEFLKRKGFQNDFGKMTEIFAERGVLRTGRVGKADIINVKTRDVFDITRQYLEQDSGFLFDCGITERSVGGITAIAGSSLSRDASPEIA